MLKDIVVSSAIPLLEKKVDRLIFNVEKSIISAGSDGLEILGKTPGIRISNTDISIIGKSGVRVMINNRLQELSGDDLINYLKMIPASEIAKIEVITNPPSQYDASGNSGLINIILKHNKNNGFVGSVNSSYKQASYGTFSTGASLSYKTDKSTLSSGISYFKGSTKPMESIQTFYPNQIWDQTDKRRDYQNYLKLQLGIDHKLSKSSNMGVNYAVAGNHPDMDEKIITTIFNNSNSIDSTILTNGNTTKKILFHSINAYYEKALDTNGRKLSIIGDFLRYNDNKIRNFTTINYNQNSESLALHNRNAASQAINLYTLKSDLELPVKTVHLAFGGKISLIDNDSKNSFYNSINDSYLIDTSKSDAFKYRESTEALYINASRTVKKFDFQIGLRGEYTQTLGRSVTYNKTTFNNYFRLFPTVFVNYKKNGNHTFSFSYGKRINRPSYAYLNPFKWYFNPYSYVEGNPFTMPSYNNNFELSHTFSNFLTTFFSFNSEINRFGQITFLTPADRMQRTTVLNYLKVNTLNWGSSLDFNKISWLESINQVTIYYNISYSSVPVTISKLSGFGGYVSSYNTILLNKNKTLIGELNFWYQFPTVGGIQHFNRVYNMDIGLKSLFFNNHLQITINVTDIFKTNIQQYYGTVNSIEQESKNYYDLRNGKLSVRYNFGKAKINNRDHHSNSDERKRVN